MANDNIFYTRIQNKHDIEANWDKVTNFIPLAGEIIVYDADENYNYSRIKIGDGVTLLKDLKFNEGSTSVLYTEQSLTNEQRAQARANIALYADGWTRISNPEIEIADYSALRYGNSPTFDMETAINQPSVVYADWCSIGAIAYYGRTMLSGTTNSAVLKMVRNVMKDYFALSDGKTLSVATRNNKIFPSEINFAMIIGVANGALSHGFAYTHVLQIIEGSRTGSIYYNRESDDAFISLTLYNYTDKTLAENSYAADAKATGDALALKADKTEIVQSDWSVTDETDMAFIKNKPDIATDEDIATFISEMGIADPVTTSDGSVYTNANGDIYVL